MEEQDYFTGEIQLVLMYVLRTVTQQVSGGYTFSFMDFVLLQTHGQTILLL